jgi:hypothetical protein
LGDRIPAAYREQTLTAIKAIHTVLFFSIGAALLLTMWDGVKGRPHRRTAWAGAIVVTETAIFISNNQVCPLTPLAEELGADSGSVVDIFLPESIARRVPLVAGSVALAALILNGAAAVRTRRKGVAL